MSPHPQGRLGGATRIRPIPVETGVCLKLASTAWARGANTKKKRTTKTLLASRWRNTHPRLCHVIARPLGYEEAGLKEAVVEEAALEEIGFEETYHETAGSEEARLKDIGFEETGLEEEARLKETCFEERGFEEARLAETGFEEVGFASEGWV